MGLVETWTERPRKVGQLVSFRATFAFPNTGEVVTSDSTLRCPHRAQIDASLTAADLVLEDVRGAPDRPVVSSSSSRGGRTYPSFHPGEMPSLISVGALE